MADGHETWYAKLSTQALPRLFEQWPWVDLDLLNGNVNFNSLPNAFVWEKGKTMDFSETVVVYDIKVGKVQSTK